MTVGCNYRRAGWENKQCRGSTAGEPPQPLGTHIPAPELWPRAEAGPSSLRATEGERLLCPGECGPKSLPLQLTLGWDGPDPDLFPRSNRFSVSGFETSNTISFLPVLPRGNPLGLRAAQLRQEDKVPAGTQHLEGLCLLPTQPGTLLILPGGCCLPFPCTTKGWDMGHGHAASKQPTVHPAEVLPLGTERASPLCTFPGAGESYWVPPQSQMGHIRVALSRGVHGHLLPPPHPAPSDAAVPCTVSSHSPCLR